MGRRGRLGNVAGLFAAFERFFLEQEWPVKVLPDQNLIVMGVQTEAGPVEAVVQVYEQAGQAVFHTLLPLKASEDRRLAVMEFVTRANFGMLLGNFELDLRDGEVRYRTTLLVPDSEPTMAQIGVVVYTNLSMMDRYRPGLEAVMERGEDPNAAVLACEGRSVTED